MHNFNHYYAFSSLITKIAEILQKTVYCRFLFHACIWDWGKQIPLCYSKFQILFCIYSLSFLAAIIVLCFMSTFLEITHAQQEMRILFLNIFESIFHSILYKQLLTSVRFILNSIGWNDNQINKMKKSLLILS